MKNTIIISSRDWDAKESNFDRKTTERMKNSIARKDVWYTNEAGTEMNSNRTKDADIAVICKKYYRGRFFCEIVEE